MTTDTDPPTIAERYQRATHSSHLRVQERRGDVDYLIAAGWLREGLGAVMYRLRVEYDTVRGEMRAAEASLPGWEEVAHEVEAKIPAAAKAWHPPLAYTPYRLQEEADRIRVEARNYVLTERAFALAKLKTLRAARDAFGAFAIVMATKVAFMQDDAAALTIAGRVLDVWLDQLCHHCDGRGFTGGSHRGEHQTLCRPCRGSGHRRDWIGKTAEERQFAGRLLAELEQNQAGVDAQMRHLLAQVDSGCVEVPDEVVAGIRARLADLRATEAERD